MLFIHSVDIAKKVANIDRRYENGDIEEKSAIALMWKNHMLMTPVDHLIKCLVLNLLVVSGADEKSTPTIGQEQVFHKGRNFR